MLKPYKVVPQFGIAFSWCVHKSYNLRVDQEVICIVFMGIITQRSHNWGGTTLQALAFEDFEDWSLKKNLQNSEKVRISGLSDNRVAPNPVVYHGLSWYSPLKGDKLGIFHFQTHVLIRLARPRCKGPRCSAHVAEARLLLLFQQLS